MTSFTLSPSLLRVVMSCTHDMQFICLDGNIVPSWKSLVSIFSEDLATLLEDIDPNDGMVSVSVSENSETVLAILSAFQEKKRIDKKCVTAAKNLGINLASDKDVLLTQSYCSESDKRIICIDKNQTKTASCNSEDLLNLSDEKGETHDIKSQINSEMLVKEEHIKHIKVTPEKKHKSALVCVKLEQFFKLDRPIKGT